MSTLYEGTPGDKRIRFHALKIVLETPGLQFASAKDLLKQAYEVEDYLRFGRQVEPEDAPTVQMHTPASQTTPIH